MDLSTLHAQQLQRLENNLNARCQAASDEYTATVDAATAEWEATMASIASITDNELRSRLASEASSKLGKIKTDAQKKYNDAVNAANQSYLLGKASLDASYSEAVIQAAALASSKKETVGSAISGAFRALTNALSAPAYRYPTFAIGIRG